MMATAEVATRVATGVVTMTDIHVAMAVARGVARRVRVMRAVMVVGHVMRPRVRQQRRGVDSRRRHVHPAACPSARPAHPRRRAEHEKEREDSARKHE